MKIIRNVSLHLDESENFCLFYENVVAVCGLVSRAKWNSTHSNGKFNGSLLQSSSFHSPFAFIFRKFTVIAAMENVFGN